MCCLYVPPRCMEALRKQASCLLYSIKSWIGMQRSVNVAGKGQKAQNLAGMGTASIQVEATAEEVIGGISCTYVRGLYTKPCYHPIVIVIWSAMRRVCKYSNVWEISLWTVSGSIEHPVVKTTMLAACSPKGCTLASLQTSCSCYERTPSMYSTTSAISAVFTP